LKLINYTQTKKSPNIIYVGFIFVNFIVLFRVRDKSTMRAHNILYDYIVMTERASIS